MKKSKAILPPWPEYYKLPSDSDCWSWSPCGTRIACAVGSTNIVIVDQRRGPLRINENDHNDLGWEAHSEDICCLKYSPDGRFLISIGDDEVVRLWDSTRNFEQLLEWNMREEVFQGMYILDSTVSVSACSKYIAVSAGSRVFLKDVEEGSTIKSVLLPDTNIFNTTTRLSSDGRAVFICVHFLNGNIAIMIWRPYLDDDDEDRLINLWAQTGLSHGIQTHQTVTFSHDNSMVAIRNVVESEGTLWSIDMEHKCLTKKFDFQGSYGFHFTPDGKYIVVNKENRPTLWSIAEGAYTNKTIHVLDNRSNTKHNNVVVKSFSPNSRQCIVQGSGMSSPYITKYFVK